MSDDPRPAADDWPDDPDAWEQADAAWRAKWFDEDPGEAPGEDAALVAPMAPPSHPTTATGVGRAYNEGMREAGPYLGLGYQIGLSMLVFVGGGIALDRWLGTEPWGVLGGAALGMLGIVVLVVRISRDAAAKGPSKRATPSAASPAAPSAGSPPRRGESTSARIAARAERRAGNRP